MTAQFDDIVARAQELLEQTRALRIPRVPLIAVPVLRETPPSLTAMLNEVHGLRATLRERAR